MKIEQGAAISLFLHNWICISFCVFEPCSFTGKEAFGCAEQVHNMWEHTYPPWSDLYFLPLQGFCNPNEQRSLMETHQGEKLWIDCFTFCSHGLIFICTCVTGSDSDMILAQFIMFPVWSPLIMSPAMGCLRMSKYARRLAAFCKTDRWWVNKSKLMWQTWWWQSDLLCHLVIKWLFLITS